jgi:hypothetical protein
MGDTNSLTPEHTSTTLGEPGIATAHELDIRRVGVQWVPGALPPRVKLQGREIDHSPSSSADVKKGGAIPPLPHMSLWHCA